MSYNPNKAANEAVWRGVERLYTALKRKGIILKGLELSKPLIIGTEKVDSIPLDFGMGYNRRHIKVTTPKKESDGINPALNAKEKDV